MTKYSILWWAIKARKINAVYRPPRLEDPPYMGPGPIIGTWMLGHE